MNLYHKKCKPEERELEGVGFVFFAVFPVHYVNHSKLVTELHSRKRLKGGGTTSRRESATVSLWCAGGVVGDAGKTASKLK